MCSLGISFVLQYLITRWSGVWDVPISSWGFGPHVKCMGCAWLCASRAGCPPGCQGRPHLRLLWRDPSQEGRLRYEGPRDMTELEDEIVVEVSYRGERRPTVTLRIPISSASDSEHPVNSADQPTAMGCSARSAERPGSFLWPLAALLVVVRRRRSGLRAL